MNLTFLCRVSRLAAIGAILLGSASCITINEELGESLIPTDQTWDVYPQDAVDLQDIRLQMTGNLSGYNTSRFTFGAVNDDLLGTSIRSTSFTLVPIKDTVDFGRNTKIRRFHFSAVRDTLSMVKDNELKMLQNVYISELKKPLDSTILYMNSLSDPDVLNEYVDLSKRITMGTPVYGGGDSLSFDFSLEYAKKVAARIDEAQKAGKTDSVSNFINYLPGIYITTDAPAGKGGRINMFNLEIETNSGYVTGNYAELCITAEYDYSEEPVDTSFLFFFGPADYIRYNEDSGSLVYPSQYAFNGSSHESSGLYEKGVKAADKIYVEGGAGVKPVIKAEEIKQILERQIAEAGIKDPSQVVINKATVIMPYDVEENYGLLEKYPDILSPTIRYITEDDKYITYAGITDASISSENQGNINRSLNMYCPDMSYHVQQILNLDRNDADYAKKIETYDIWFLIMHEEITVTDNSSSYYDNYPYNYYYNNMMYDPYGYGYGGYGGYGYGGYGGYGYNNYYNYAMMAMMYGSMNSSTESVSTELDKDRYYNAILNGPEAAGAKPQFKVTFSAPKSAE